MLCFLTTHSSQIVKLRLAAFDDSIEADPLIAELAKLSWPSLRKFIAYNAPRVTLVESLPQLKELELFIKDAAAFVALPDRLLTALCGLRIEEVTGDFLTHLRKFPRLRVLSTLVPEALWREHHESLSRVVANAVIDHWDLLPRSPEMRWLRIHRAASAVPHSPVELTHLKWVAIGGMQKEHRFEFATALLLAHGVMNSHPHVNHIDIFTQRPKEDEEIVERIKQLVAAGLTRNLRGITIDADGELLPALRGLPAVQYGWLTVVSAYAMME